MVLKFTGWV